MTLPAGATVYNKRSLPMEPEKLPDFLGRELNIVDRAIKSTNLTPYRSVAGDFTLTLDDGILLVDATAGAVTVTLPDVRRAAGRSFFTKKADVSGTAVTVSSSALIDGATTYALTVQFQSVTVLSDGTTWWVV
jgi:hypothetical protein